MTPTITQEDAFTAIKGFLDTVLTGCEVVQGQDNRVPMPTSPNFVVMTAVNRAQLAQTTHDYRPDDDEQDIARSTSLTFQIDVYGDAAADNAQVITTLMRDAYGVDLMSASGVHPLYCGDPQQMPLLTGEQQYLQRWTIGCVVQANLGVTVTTQFADSLVTTLQEVK